MMKTRRTGTLCPKKDTGGMMRRGMIALVVLLLACVLMAGAVSAEDIVLISDTSGNTLGQLLSEGKSVKLDVDVTYSESISIKSGNSSILDLNGKKLTLSKDAGINSIITLGDNSYDNRGSLRVIDTSP